MFPEPPLEISVIDGLPFRSRSITVGAPSCRPSFQPGFAAQFEAVGGFFAQVNDSFVGDLVAGETEQSLCVVEIPAAVIADYPDLGIGTLGRRHGHADGGGGGVEFSKSVPIVALM